MEIMIPIQSTEFNFDSGCSTPYMSAPSSPKRFGEYYSAPTSPMRASMIYQDYQDYNRYVNSSPSVIPPSEDEFAFDFDGKLDSTSVTAADELFDDGKIKPLTFPMRSQLSNESTHHKSSLLSPKSQGKKMFWESFTPREKKEFNPYSDSTDSNRRSSEQNRGRGRSPTKSNVSTLSSNSSRRRETRSLSPLRVAEFSSYEQQQQQEQSVKEQQKSDSASSSSSSLKGSRKWRIRDFLLFRSASEGRASDKDPLRKYTALFKKNEDDNRNSSFRSIDSTSSSVSKRKGGSVSAHEIHYKVNRANIEESKKKTYLPYKPGLLGCIGFNPTAYGLSQRL